MLSRWSRAFVLVAVAALIANAQCFGSCVTGACSSTKAPSNSCHHHKSPDNDKDTTRCLHQHSYFAGPEAGIAKVTIVSAILPALTDSSAAISVDFKFLPKLDTGSPPGCRSGSTISVLRV